MGKATDFGIFLSLFLISIPLWVIAIELKEIRKKLKP